jgi:tetratricopeptide (TPR) repeat protein
MLTRRARVRLYRTRPDWLRLEADAWRELAEVWKRCNHLMRARRAALRAKALYRRPELAPLKDEARLDLTLGQIVFQQNQHEQGLAIVQRAGERLRDDWHDPLAFAKALAIYGTLLMRIREYERALPYFHESIKAGGSVLDDDEFTVAANLFNHAFCAIETGDPSGPENLALAREKFEALGLVDPLLRCDALGAVLLRRQGRVSEAISELYKVRSAFAALGLPNTASRWTVTIVEWLMEQQRFSEAVHAAEGEKQHLLDAGLYDDATRLDELLGKCTAA